MRAQNLAAPSSRDRHQVPEPRRAELEGPTCGPKTSPRRARGTDIRARNLAAPSSRDRHQGPQPRRAELEGPTSGGESSAYLAQATGVRAAAIRVRRSAMVRVIAPTPKPSSRFGSA
jgi:hypothetical protein